MIDAEDRDMGHEDNYTPMRRMERDYTPDERNLLSEMMQRHHLKRGYAEKGMTLARQDIKRSIKSRSVWTPGSCCWNRSSGRNTTSPSPN